MKESEKKTSSSSSTWNRCSECSMSFPSTKALFGHLRIHRKRNRGARKTSLLSLRQARHSEDVIAACILMEIRRSKSETDIDAAKLSKLRWVCDKIETQRKMMKEVATGPGEENVGQCSTTCGIEEVNAARCTMSSAVDAAAAAIHRCDKCHKVFNSGQALGGHKRAHYTGPPLCRSSNNKMSKPACI